MFAAFLMQSHFLPPWGSIRFLFLQLCFLRAVMSSPKRRFLTAEEAEKLRQAKIRRMKRLKAKREAERKAKEAEEEAKRKAQEEEERRWQECLQCLKDSVPQLRKNPWLIVQV